MLVKSVKAIVKPSGTALLLKKCPTLTLKIRIWSKVNEVELKYFL